MDQTPYKLNVKFLRQLLIIADDIMHFAVALVLLVCAGLIMIKTVPNLVHPDINSILHILNDVLLALIVMELMWPVVRFLRRKPFSLNPFLYIGIISCIRRILLIEAEHSMLSRTASEPINWQGLWPVLVELGSYASIILVLVISLRLLSGPAAGSET